MRTLGARASTRGERCAARGDSAATRVAAGATVWITAFWFNPRKQAGPVADAISANLPGGSVSLIAA